jgi:hypothetical protein
MKNYLSGDLVAREILPTKTHPEQLTLAPIDLSTGRTDIPIPFVLGTKTDKNGRWPLKRDGKVRFKMDVETPDNVRLYTLRGKHPIANIKVQ